MFDTDDVNDNDDDEIEDDVSFYVQTNSSGARMLKPIYGSNRYDHVACQRTRTDREAPTSTFVIFLTIIESYFSMYRKRFV
jgi:hypothetical protein